MVPASFLFILSQFLWLRQHLDPGFHKICNRIQLRRCQFR